MARLNGQDGPGGAEDGLVRQQRRGAQVRGDADVFQHGGRGDHARGVGEVEVVLAALHGLDAALGERRLQQGYVLLLGLADLRQVLDLLLIEAEGGKVGFLEFGEAFAVEGLF